MQENKIIQFFSDFGYEKFGPLLLLFSKWLQKELEKKQIKKVYFLARDGFIMKKAFDIVNDNKNIKSSYFYASRRSIIVPSLWKLNKADEIFDVIAFNKNISIKSFLKKVGLDNYKKVEYFLIKYNYTLDTSINLVNSKNFKNFLKEIFPLIKENSKQEYISFQKYIEVEKFTGKVAIVDIGWFGSMQKALNNIVNDANVYGYYFGLIPDAKMCNDSFGFLFDTNKNKDIYEKFHYFINIFEFLFLAQHGSVKRFINNQEFVEFYEYEYKNMIEKDIAETIQKEALKYIATNKNEKLSHKEVINNFMSEFLNPNLKTAQLFGNIKFKDDEFKYIAKPQKFLNYIFKITNLKLDFINSAWRIGFMKRLFIIPLPYYKINCFLRKKLKKEVNK